MYYLLVMTATAMFAVQFMLNGKYQWKVGSSLASSMVFSAGMGLIGAVILFIINDFKLTLTPFSVLLGIVFGLNSMLFNLCSIYAFGHINLSVYSLFSMTGGMVLPFIGGICFFREDVTVAKILCLITLFAGLLMTVKKGGKSDGKLFYLGVFFFNGMGALLTVIYKKAPFEKAPDDDFSITSALLKVIISLTVLAVILIVNRSKVKKGGKRITLRPFVMPLPLVFTALCGILNNVGNYLLLTGLNKIHASMQYMLVTGGVIVFSTILGYFSGKKPTSRDLAAVGICIAGMCFLFLPF